MADLPKNIQRFNLIALETFRQLYDAFPKPTDLDATSLGIQAIEGAEHFKEEEGEEYFNIFDVVPDVIEWLTEEGFVRHIENPNPHVTQTVFGVRLTLKGLVILGYVPTSVSEQERREPLIARVKRLLEKGAEGAASEAGKNLVLQILGAAVSPTTITAVTAAAANIAT